MRSHAATPRVLQLDSDLFRVFFATRDESNRSQIAWGDIDMNNPLRLVRLSDKPALSPGGNGFFDDSGVLPSCIVDMKDTTALFYIGVSKSSNVPFHSFAGLAKLNKSKTHASRVLSTPVLDRTPGDPLSIGGVSVVFDIEKRKFHMWYGSTRAWVAKRGSLDEQPAIKYATSLNGTDWVREDVFCFEPTEEIDYFGTPSVLKDKDLFRMWFSFKVDGQYRIGYAESLDGINWALSKEGAGITVSESGWDSAAVGYPNVFQHGDNLFMVYSGNQFGKTGFGIAILEDL